MGYQVKGTEGVHRNSCIWINLVYSTVHVLCLGEMCNIRPYTLSYTDDGFKEGIMYAGIFLGGFIIIAVLCAVILYKYKKWTNAVPNTTTESQVIKI